MLLINLYTWANVSRDVLCTRVGWYDFTVGSSRNHESTTTTATIGFMSKTTTMKVHNILPSLHDYDLRYPYATFCEKHEHLPTNLPFFFFCPECGLFCSTPAKFAFNCQVNREERERVLLVTFSLQLLSWLRELPVVRPRKNTDHKDRLLSLNGLSVPADPYCSERK